MAGSMASEGETAGRFEAGYWWRVKRRESLGLIKGFTTSTKECHFSCSILKLAGGKESWKGYKGALCTYSCTLPPSALSPVVLYRTSRDI